MCDARVWEDQARSLSAIGEVRIADFYGFDSIDAMARSVLDAVPGPIDVVGHSMGGRVAFQVMRLAPERVRRFAVLDTGVHLPNAAEPAKRQVLVDLAWQQGMDALAAAWLPPMVHPARHGDAALMGSLREMVLAATPAIFEGQIRALLGRPDAREVLARIACPTLVLCGRQDEWSPLARHEEIAGSIPGAELVAIEESGHMVTVEQPAAVSQALLRFLSA